MSAEMEALAHAWEAGWTAASDRAQRAVLLAATVGVTRAVEQLKGEEQVANPYRIESRRGAA